MTRFRSHRFSVAPMMDWTDRHCRLFHRALTSQALLYTEMVTTGAVRFGPRERLLGFSSEERPLAAQLGGSEPEELAEAARICEGFGYDEINLNVGCPSDRVQDGRFGACLMAEPDRVARGVAAMKAAVSIPVTVKCRIGIDDQDPEEALDRLADAVVAAGCDALIVHARKAWLKGLSPKENRDVPPLDYDRVFRLKRRFPDLPVSINGGIGSIEQARALLEPRDGVTLDGVMLGRAAYQNAELLLAVDPLLFGEAAPHADARAAVESLFPAIEAHLARGGRLSNFTRHMLGLFPGRPGARAFRRLLSEEGPKAGAGLDVLRAALDLVGDARPSAVAAAA
ncbi:tRNA-dihydrouridine synthase A [Hansschlegelia beijingensis]|uniref:tRNA-dihydrouridine(20/20a) synthase n=2 Tax=Hansschlegelia beijingensis TaxID=1133344 RepID=A0A7W6GFY2_9HYPH|nr:tRNA dihydrouridine(20/20a) synthase DusA [Hansschlegelia beijingensis]MBB3973790.1 tRNA-dihydrouridine synthase A [Hansschlegelia beijingensis]